MIHRLPINQDYHEMWSRKRRKEKAAAAAAASGKHGRSNKEERVHHHSDLSSGPLSPSPDKRKEGKEGSLPPSNRSYRSDHNDQVESKQPLSVPRPSAPLSKGILDGIEVGGVAGEPSSSSTLVNASLQMKQVIAEAQRSLITQLQQQLEAGGGSVPSSMHTYEPRVSVEGYDDRRTQTFDYGNKSNKELERAADEELQRNYYR